MTVSLSQCQPAAWVTQLPSPPVSNPSALCCQTNPPQAKLDLISSQHRNLMAPHCVLKKDQPLQRGIQIPLQAPWNMPSQPRLCQPPSVLGCSASLIPSPSPHPTQALLPLHPASHAFTHLFHKYLWGTYYEPGRACSRLGRHRHRPCSEAAYGVVEKDDNNQEIGVR